MKRIIIVIVLLIVGFMVWKFIYPVNPLALGAALGERCGGNMTTAPKCGTGLHCAPEPGSHLPFGDVGGTCVKD